MGSLLAPRLPQEKIVQMLFDMQQALLNLRMNQVQKLQFNNITIDGTGSTGRITIGTNTAISVYIQPRVAGGIDIFRSSDNTKIASLDQNGNLKTLGTITPSTTP